MIVAIIINTIQGMVWGRARAYIYKEAPKIMPLITDLYPSSSIPGIPKCVRIFTSTKHGSPDSIFWAIPHAMLSDCISMITATTFCSSTGKCICPSNNFISTITSANPISVLVLGWCGAQDYQPLKFLSHNVNFPWHLQSFSP